MKIICPKLPDFDLGDREAVRASFASAPMLEMQQAWRHAPEDRFRPGLVRIGWKEDRFLVFGELIDDELFNLATEDNQLLCNFGDVFEIFLRDVGGECYAELHIAPNGRRLQLLWPDAAAVRRAGSKRMSLDEIKVDEPIFDFTQWSVGGIWRICASVPSPVFLPPGTTLEGRTWNASFSRYDYSSAEAAPVLSSTSPHAEVSFHRQQEWAELLFLDE